MRRATILLRVLLAAGIAYLAWRFIDPGELTDNFRRISLPVAIALVGVALVDRLVMALKWQRLLVALELGTSFWRVVVVYFEASFLQRLLPSSLGGDAIRAAGIGSDTGRYSEVLASIAVEKIVATAASALLLLCALPAAVYLISDALRLAVSLALAALVAGLWGLRLASRSGSLERLAAALPGARLRVIATRIARAYRTLETDSRAMSSNLLLAVAEQAVGISIIALAALATGTEAIALVVVAGAIAQVVKKFAIVLEGWLLGETAAVMIYAACGIPAPDAISFVIVAQAAHLIASLPGAIMVVIDGSWRKVVSPRSR